MLIRDAEVEDVPALVALFVAWGHPQPAAVVAERLDVWRTTAHARVLVAEFDDEVGGVAAVSASPHFARPGRFARLTGLAVGDRFRRRGVATALVRAVEALAREWGCDRVEVTSTRARDEAPGFYAALGYLDQSERQARYIHTI